MRDTQSLKHPKRHSNAQRITTNHHESLETRHLRRQLPAFSLEKPLADLKALSGFENPYPARKKLQATGAPDTRCHQQTPARKKNFQRQKRKSPPIGGLSHLLTLGCFLLSWLLFSRRLFLCRWLFLSYLLFGSWLLLGSSLFLGWLFLGYLLFSSWLLLSSSLFLGWLFLSRCFLLSSSLLLGRCLLLGSSLLLGRCLLLGSYFFLSSRLFLCSFFLCNHFHRSCYVEKFVCYRTRILTREL